MRGIASRTRARPAYCSRASSGDPGRNMPRRSAPAQNARSPAPRMMTTRAAGLASSSASAAPSSRIIVAFNAFRASGRLSVSVATPSRASIRSVS